MKLRVLKKGSKTTIRLGFCCASPVSFSQWAEGRDTAYLKKPDKVLPKPEFPGKSSP